MFFSLEAGGASAEAVKVTAPPSSFFEWVDKEDREVARGFYKKHLEVDGLPVVAAEVVADEALHRTHWMVSHMLAGRTDILQAMVSNGMYLVIIGKDQVYTDMPEYRNVRNPEFMNERVRGTGGRPTSFGEENLLSLPLDRYDDESIAVHEFCHTIDSTLRGIDPTWRERRDALYERSKDKPAWRGTYAAGNPGEFWAEIAQSYFDCNRVNNWNHGPVGNREQLREMDPESYEFVHEIFALKPEQDWRYKWAQSLPNVTAPPPQFKIDPYYTKFTWAREFTVVGREASDEGLLRANDVIRKMFAYRHDVLKALINGGWKVAVIKKGEKIPREAATVVVEEGDDLALVAAMAKTFYEVTGSRPVDPNWNDRGRDVQQYELRVKRLDETFGRRLKEIQEKGGSRMEAGDYWTQGVAKYFSPQRERLALTDADLYALVHETMAYEGRPDWRLRP